MEQRVFLFETEDRNLSLGFDTGLDSRGFAQAKFAQFISEPGLIIRSGSSGLWYASGVVEYSGATMVVWGPAFDGEPLLTPVCADDRKDEAIEAVAAWIKALIFLDGNPAPEFFSGGNIPFQPSAVLIGKKDPAFPDGKNRDRDVFFVPPGLAMRCMVSGGEWYIHPDLCGSESAAYTAAAMLYRIFTGEKPFSQTDDIILRQDIRDGNFLSVRLAAPALDEGLASLIQNIMTPHDGKPGNSGKAVMSELLAILQPEGKIAGAVEFLKPVCENSLRLIEKEKSQYIRIKTASVKTRRFVMRNTAILLGILAAFVAAVLVAVSIVNSRAMLPTTAGMDPVQVIETYYNAIGDLDHQLMEACVYKKAGKDDIGMVVNFYVINKVRQAYEFSAPPLFISAREWQNSGSAPVESGVFGVTDLSISRGNAESGEVRYRVDYTLWIPAQMGDDPAAESDTGEFRPPLPANRSDTVTLALKRGNWRITAIRR